jgi:prophage regulatory protein
MKVLVFRDLRDRGIPWSRQHIHRLVKAGKFPAPFKLGENTNAWFENVIDQHLEKIGKAHMETAPSG